MEAFIIVVAELVLGKPEVRAQYTILLPKIGTAAAARAWFEAELPAIRETYPGRVRDNFTLYYTQLTQLSWT